MNTYCAAYDSSAFPLFLHSIEDYNRLSTIAGNKKRQGRYLTLPFVIQYEVVVISGTSSSTPVRPRLKSNICSWFRHLSRRLLIKDSTKALSVGFPGYIKGLRLLKHNPAGGCQALAVCTYCGYRSVWVGNKGVVSVKTIVYKELTCLFIGV